MTYTVKFGLKDEPGFSLKKSGNLIVVGVQPRLDPSADQLRDAEGECVMMLLDKGLKVYRVDPDAMETRLANWSEHPDVNFAGTALTRPDTVDPVLYSRQLFIKFHDTVSEVACHHLLKTHDLDVYGVLGYAKNAYCVQVPAAWGSQIFTYALTLLESSDVEFCHPQLVRERKLRAIHPNQWHLKPTTVEYRAYIDQSANVEAAHRLTKGAGTVIAVIDDGFDIEHPEFAGPGKVVWPHDSDYDEEDPRPVLEEQNHGTSCAGVACANGIEGGASGVAPEAALMPIQNTGLGGQEEADAFIWAADHGADVISCSWGAGDGAWYDASDELHENRNRLPATTRLAIDYAVSKGRGGKGCVVVFAAGNGNESVELDGYASYRNVIAVAACNDRGVRCVYSDFGPSIWCCFPSSDYFFPGASIVPLTRGIWTTDRRGADGWNPGRKLFYGDEQGDYRDNFGGTSSSAPGVAGVAALILSVNPELTWQQVRDVLKKTCDQIDSKNGAYNAKGHSHKYGYGRVNAERAVLLAQQLKDEAALKG